MMRITMSIATLAVALALAGCNETDGGAMAGPEPSSPPPTTGFVLPRDAACSKEIDGYVSVVRADLSTGNVEQQVYDQIQTEMTRAAHACAVGNGGESHAIVAASKARHGYRA